MLTDDQSFDNKFLRLSLVQELRSLNCLRQTILTDHKVTVSSWLHPSPTHMLESETISLLKIKNDGDQMKCLELIIDRIYSILNAFVNVLENMPKIRNSIHRNVSKPKKLTLGLTASTLYEKIQHLSALMYDEKLYTVENIGKCGTQTSEKEVFDKDTQVNTRLIQCPSCAIAQKCIKSIAEELTNSDNDTAVSRAKSKLKSTIFNSSQEQSLDLLTNAINEDIRDLIEHNWELEMKLDDIKKQLSDVEINHHDSLKKIDELERNVLELEKYKDKEIQKQSTLHNIINKLYREKRKFESEIQQGKDQIELLQNLIESQTCNTNDLQEEIETLQNKAKCLVSQEELLNSEKDLWKVRFNHSHEENNRLKCQNKELHSKLDELRVAISSIEGSFRGLEKNISESTVVIDDNFRAYEDLLKKTQDVVNSSAAFEDKLKDYAQRGAIMDSEITNIIQTNVEVKGDPLLDMMKQVECNNINIRKMELQNETLIKTIKKFQNLNIPK